jgi:hypothetical protein
MRKKGQAMIFVVLGIILVIAVIMYFVGVKTEIIPPLLTSSSAASELNEVEDHVEECLEEIGSEYLHIIGTQGGYLSPGPDTYRLYNDTLVSYLCWNQENLPTCTNRLLILEKMDDQLTKAIEDSLDTCMNVYDFSSDIEVGGEREVEVDINLQQVRIDMYYPLTIDKGDDDFASEDEFSVVLNVPLGELYLVSQDIVNQHATIGDFDQLLYMLSKLSRYTIYKNKPYPDIVYQVRLREGSYVFQFAIQGESNV